MGEAWKIVAGPAACKKGGEDGNLIGTPWGSGGFAFERVQTTVGAKAFEQ